MTLRDRWWIAKSTIQYYVMLGLNIVWHQSDEYIHRCVYCGRKTSMSAVMLDDDFMYPSCCCICAVRPGPTGMGVWQKRLATTWEKMNLPPVKPLTDEEVAEMQAKIKARLK
jgi:hypothetical protein